MPKLRGFGTGDLLVKIKVEVPKNLNAEEKETLHKYAKLRNEGLN